MELIKEIEFTTPVGNMTGEQVGTIVTDGILKTFVEYMSKNKIPYLHARQVGIEMNFFVWQYKDKWKLMINPQVRALKKDTKLLNTVELSYTNRTEKGTPRLFQTKRAPKVIAVYDDYKNESKYKRKALNLKGHLSSVFQQMCNISEGLNITRFTA